jgi:hypothetical protein
MTVAAPSSAPPEPRSILIFGSGESAMSVLAAGLAELVRPEFAWANCAGSPSQWEDSVARMMERRSRGRRAEATQPSDLQMHEAPSEAIARVVVPESLPGEQRQRLVEFVRLPPLLQRLISNAAPGGDAVSVVLTNVDGLPDPVVATTLASPELHDSLHHEGITLLVTFRGIPSLLLKEAFDQIYRVELPRAGSWMHSSVTSERGLESPDLLLPQTLAEAWTILGLNPDLIAL